MIDEVSDQLSLSHSLSLSISSCGVFQGILHESEKSSPSRVGNKCLSIHIIRSQHFLFPLSTAFIRFPKISCRFIEFPLCVRLAPVMHIARHIQACVWIADR